MARTVGSDLSALRRELAAGEIAAVYLVHGEEAFLKEQAAAEIRRSVLGEGSAEEAAWNLTILEAASSSLVEILDAARTLPMLAPRRLVLVKEAEKLREGDVESLKDYLKDPAPTSCILMVAGSGKPDFRKA